MFSMAGLRGTRQRLNVLSLALLLSLTVFLWGLNYKVSLYYAQTSRHAVPAAKLLSQRERPQSVGAIEHLLSQRDWLAKLPKTHTDGGALIVPCLPEQAEQRTASIIRACDPHCIPAASTYDPSAPRAPPSLA